MLTANNIDELLTRGENENKLVAHYLRRATNLDNLLAKMLKRFARNPSLGLYPPFLSKYRKIRAMSHAEFHKAEVHHKISTDIIAAFRENKIIPELSDIFPQFSGHSIVVL